MTGRRVGLTGARGVLGRRLAAEIESSGDLVVPLMGDVRHAGAVRDWARQCERLVHAAAIVPTGRVAELPSDAIAVNVGGTANVAKAATEFDLHVTYVSSSHVYSPRLGPVTETDPTEPATFYGLTKLQGEAVLRLLAPKHLIVRVFSYFDARQKAPFLVPSLCDRIARAMNGAELELQGASHVRDLVDGCWVARTSWALAGHGHTGTVNCGSGHGATVMEIATATAAALGRPDIVWQGTPDAEENSLVADTCELVRRIGEPWPFDLALALTAATAGILKLKGAA